MKLALLALMVSPSFTPESEMLEYHCPEEARASECVEASNCPVLRVPPVFPQSCGARMADEERVVARLNVLKSGLVESGKIVESTNPCFDGAALRNFCRYRYPAADISRTEVETLVFKLDRRPEEEPHE